MNTQQISTSIQPVVVAIRNNSAIVVDAGRDQLTARLLFTWADQHGHTPEMAMVMVVHINADYSQVVFALVIGRLFRGILSRIPMEAGAETFNAHLQYNNASLVCDLELKLFEISWTGFNFCQYLQWQVNQRRVY